MSRAAYSRRTCRCGKEVSVAGCAYNAHMMAHVRKGEATVERKLLTGLFHNEFRWVKEPTKQK